MTEPLFTIASDQALIALIARAQRRLAVVAPALSDAVAASLIARLSDAGRIDITIVLDADAEVYRLGYGSIQALEKLRLAASDQHVPLLLQPGIRIAMIAADDELLIFAPVPELIEAGSTSPAKPNAIRLGGDAASQAVVATNDEIGSTALTPEKAEIVNADLKANPPLPFNVARAVRVFSAEARYVELEVENCRFASRQIELPRELLDVADEALRERMGGRIRPFDKTMGSVTFAMQTPAGDAQQTVDEGWISAERARIEKKYTFAVPGFGRVMLRKHQELFDADITRFEENVRRYRTALIAALAERKTAFVDQIIKEFAPRWRAKTPLSMAHWGNPSAKELDEALVALANKVADDSVSFGEPKARTVYKEIAPESVADSNFVEPLTAEMGRRGVPRSVIDKLFRTFTAAEEGIPATVNKGLS